MGTRTPNYDLYIPGQGEEAWDDEVGGNFTTIDAALQALADTIDGAVYQINNVTYVASNARWNGSAWNRVDTGRPAVRMMLNSTTGILEIATAAAGTNPISWTTIQAVSASGIDMKSKKIYNLATPTAATDAATKAYVDGSIAKVLPYRPETWPTEELDWGDGEPEQLYDADCLWSGGSASDKTIMTVASGTRVIVTLAPVPSKAKIRNPSIKVNGVVVATYTGLVSGTHTFPPFVVNAGDVIVISATPDSNGGMARVTIESTGEVCGEKTFNLTGKWLALGLDMKGLAATVKIQGISMPYSDYPLYFPIAPSELKIPGNWSTSQVRPVIKRYV